MNDFKSINNIFFKFENKLNLFNKKINGVYFWELVRFGINRKILIEKGLITIPHKGIDNKLVYILKNILTLLYKVIFKNPYFGKKEAIYIIGHSRRPKVDLYNTDIYTKNLKEILNKNDIIYQDLETFSQKFILNKDKESDNILYLDFFNIFSLIFKNKVQLSNEDKNYILNLEKELSKEFNIKLNLFENIKSEINSFNIYYKMIYKYLKLKKPKILIEVVSYSGIIRAINKAAKELSIPIIELQHGVIDKYHLGYSTGEKNDINFKYFPDYIFTWGDYWSKVCNYPKNIKTISTGFPYFELNKSKYSDDIKQEKNIVIISQPQIGEKLSEYIYDIAKSLNDYTFYYKLHPSEFHKINKEFSFLNELKNIKIITSEKTVYDLSNICSFQIGVCSTALYEGLGFGLKTIIFNLPGSEYLDDLVDKKIVKKVRSSEDCIDIINNKNFGNSKDFDSKSFFKSNSINNMLEVIKKIQN